MTAIRIDKFMGAAPRLSNRLLPDTAATVAQNARLMSGELRGIREPSEIHRFNVGPVRNTRRIFKTDGTPVWLALENADTDIAKGLLINDSLSRYYWTGEEAYVAYNSLARIEAGDPAYRLGTPTPTATFAVGVTGGDEEAVETRIYTYTYINSWGEESAPAQPVTTSGTSAGTWTLTGLPTTAPDMNDRLPVTHKRIYRTVTGLGSVAYFLVEQIALATATFEDTVPNATVSLNIQLQSFVWAPPPDSLMGLVAHPNGFMVGFSGRDLYFSERYRPHAWPVQYVLTVEHDIVGLTIYSNMIAVLTKGNPYFAAGSGPSSISLHKSESSEPCLSKLSIAASLSGVLYASQNGLVLLNESSASVVSSAIMTIEEWALYSPASMKGAQYGQQYLAYYTSSQAIRFAPNESFGNFVEIDKFDNVDNVLTDPTSGECWILRNNRVYRWEPPGGTPLYYTWKSKEFDFTRPVNFGAYMVKSEAEPISVSAAAEALYIAFNAARFAAGPLNPLNFTALNGSRVFSVGTEPLGIADIQQNRYPVGGSPLFNVAQQIADTVTSVTLCVFADGRLVYQHAPDSLRTYRLPAGFKAHVWQFELIGNSNVYSLAIAEVGKELASV